MGTINNSTAEGVAERFHAAYEELAPDHGYSTRAASAVPWASVPDHNKSLMIAVADKLIKDHVIDPMPEHTWQQDPIPSAPTHDPRLVASDEERLASLRLQRDRFKRERDEPHPALVATDAERLTALREQRDRFKGERDEARGRLARIRAEVEALPLPKSHERYGEEATSWAADVCDYRDDVLAVIGGEQGETMTEQVVAPWCASKTCRMDHRIDTPCEVPAPRYERCPDCPGERPVGGPCPHFCADTPSNSHDSIKARGGDDDDA